MCAATIADVDECDCRAAAAAVLVVLVSIVFGFSDPAFGFDLVSLRLVLSLAIAFFILFYGVSWLTGLIVDRGWKVTSVVTIQPSIVLFAILGAYPDPGQVRTEHATAPPSKFIG